MTRWEWFGWAILVVSSSACGGQSAALGMPGGSGGSGAVVDAAPWLTLPVGSRYFARDGRQAPLLLRNATAGSVAAFLPLLQAAHAAGAQAIRVQLTQGFGYATLGIDRRGAVLANWAASWDAVFTAAQQQQLAVIPVFAIWGDWNDGTPGPGLDAFFGQPAQSGARWPSCIPSRALQRRQ